MKRRKWTGLYQPLRARKPATWVMPYVLLELANKEQADAESK